MQDEKPAEAPQVKTVPKTGRKGKRKLSDLKAEHRQVFATPSGFAKFVLKMPLSAKQAELVDAVAPQGSNVVGVFCNEGGKTTRCIATLVLWHCTVFTRTGDNGGVTATSGSWSQITNQLMPALRAHQSKFPKWEFLDTEIKVNGVPNFMCYSVTHIGRAEGFHGSPESPLLAIVDEAKSVRDEIAQVIEDRCRPQRSAYLSSPGFASGFFYDANHSRAAFYKRFKVTAADCPWIDQAAMRRTIEKAGGGDYEKGLLDPVIRSAYFAEFMPFVEGAIISLSDVSDCLADPPRYVPGDRKAFCDFAAGGDENVLAARHGNKVWIVDAWRDTNTMSAVGRFVTNFRRLRDEFGFKPEDIDGDADGLGKPMVDALAEAGWPINEYHANAPAQNPMDFKNKSSEVWFKGAELIKSRKVIIPDEPELHGQLCDRKARYESSGRRWIESKHDLFKRQSADGRPQRSPDRADAVLGAMQDGLFKHSTNLIESLPSIGMSKRYPYEQVEPDEKWMERMEVEESILEALGGAGW